MRNDIERAVNTVLSGLTVDAAQQEEIVRNAIRSGLPSQKPPKPRDLRLKLKLSLTFPLPHLVVAALVVVIVTLAPLFTLPQPQQDPHIRYSSEDGQDYFVTGDVEPTPHTGAIAAPGDIKEAFYRGTSFEDAEKAYQTHLPRITWLPEGAVLEMIDLGTIPDFRDAVIVYAPPQIMLHITDYANGEKGLMWVPQDQEGEYMTLSNGQTVYVTTNHGDYAIVWQKGCVNYSLYTAASLEDALRMVESIR